MKSNKKHTLTEDMDFFTAGLSGSLITVWQEDPAGVYCEIGRGYVEAYTNEAVRVRNLQSGTKSLYSRESTMFQTD
ncbi:hypothetical protein PTI45_00767 [Paenibacillus nuruki]|uniref:Uncharacterized protein n=1 Tax=Paenibacillus nuruki TaxID=1886670 RepID=A0A1E3L7N8_9BACL|nr:MULTISPECIES: hypothetical protein [Paenibacillus]ODP29789.1 hypothetical protein PTI45_00767 [Paenibacillus nuruki]TKJ90253.1 hypothetical protein PaeCFBP13512_13695 [Paenibacillus sp. CFBP13512]CAJ1313770.1 KTSC domain-containing protein [Paenibacillus nuruki]